MPTNTNNMLILTGDDVRALLHGREQDIVEMVKRAYMIHSQGHSALPHSTFLRFPNKQLERIIALPAYIGDDINVAGIKWIASFPDNLRHGLDRASATIILNSTETGYPQVVMEGSIISARRTAASAALAAATLHQRPVSQVALLGCGLINFEILRFLRAVFPRLASCVVYDLHEAHARQFRERAMGTFEDLDVVVAADAPAMLRSAELIAFATTSGTPYLDDPTLFAPHATVLHISLRDLSPAIILAADNVVDDIDHVSRAQTSIHLTVEQTGARDCIRCTLADVLHGKAPARASADRPVIFSPFGLGILDMALSRYVYEHALVEQRGTRISNFVPEPWRQG